MSSRCRLSVNINKIATLRNSRGGNMPDVLAVAADCERFGGEGITVHPRPDERHIRYADVRALRPRVQGEFNIEGNPSHPPFVDLVLEVRPDQVTLVPDADDAITSNAGWDTIRYAQAIRGYVEVFHAAGIRVSIFLDPIAERVRAAADTGADRIELYTERYAHDYLADPESAVAPYREAAFLADALGLGVNAGHDLNLHNLRFLYEQLPMLAEVSIGHALVCDALYLGLETTITRYRDCLKRE